MQETILHRPFLGLAARTFTLTMAFTIVGAGIAWGGAPQGGTAQTHPSDGDRGRPDTQASSPVADPRQDRASQVSTAPERATKESVAAADRRGDFDYLWAVCSRPRGMGPEPISVFACEAVVRHLEKRGDHVRLELICNNREKVRSDVYPQACAAASRARTAVFTAQLAKCDTQVATYEKLKKSIGFSWNLYMAAGEASVKCANWTFFFDHLVIDRGGGSGLDAWGVKLLSHFEKNGVAVEDGLLSYLKTNRAKPFPGTYGCNIVVHIVGWLNAGRRFENCERFLPFMDNMSGCARAQLGNYFRMAKCAKAVPFFEKQLSSTDPNTRVAACIFLGEHGTKRQIRKLQILAKSDGVWKMFRGQRIYWVRDVCNEAIGRIKLR